MGAIDLRVWGSALLVALALWGIAWLLLHLLRTTSSRGVRWLAGAGLLIAILASGPAVIALVQIGLPADVRVVPGLVGQWAPAVSIASGLALVLTRKRFRHA